MDFRMHGAMIKVIFKLLYIHVSANHVAIFRDENTKARYMRDFIVYIN
jgi:hypothetical protein